ncbi:hypothetical protein RCL1_008489 [Eukaryota sp. TZLM3-RCL]
MHFSLNISLPALFKCMEVYSQLLLNFFSINNVACFLAPGLDERGLIEGFLRLCARKLSGTIVVLDCPYDFSLPSSSFNLPPLSILSEGIDINQRTTLYQRKGIILTSSRTFSTDLLRKRVSISDISCLLLCKAHIINREHPSAFVVRLVLLENKGVRIKAISNYAIGSKYSEFTKSIPVDRILVQSRDSELMTSHFDPLLPPINLIVSELTDLTKSSLQLINKMMEILLNEYNKISGENFKVIDVLTLNTPIKSSFFTTKDSNLSANGLISDLFVIRRLFFSILNQNCVVNLFDFIRFHLDAVALSKSASETSQSISPPLWPFLDNSAQLLTVLIQRVINLEHHPKQSKVVDCLTELQQPELSRGHVLLIVKDNFQARKWKSILTGDYVNELKSELINYLIYFGLIESETLVATPPSFPVEPYFTTVLKSQKIKQLVTKFLDFENFIANFPDLSVKFTEDVVQNELYPDFSTIKMIDFCPFLTITSSSATTHNLRLIKPQSIILINPTHVIIRHIELYSATIPNGKSQLSVSVFFFGQEELNLFESYKVNESYELSRLSVLASNHTPSPLLFSPKSHGSVLVDSREFRSSLPLALHEKGLEIVPVTLITGDYVISDTVVIERKTVSDLSSSLNSGHLQKQVRKMFNYFTSCILLIELPSEFSHEILNQSNDFDHISRDNSLKYLSTPVANKLSSLVISWPKLSIIWSHGPIEAAQLITNLKANLTEPNLINLNHVLESSTDDDFPLDFADQTVANCVGILVGNDYKHDVIKNATRNNCKCLADLINQNDCQLNSIMVEEGVGAKLYRVFNEKVSIKSD